MGGSGAAECGMPFEMHNCFDMFRELGVLQFSEKDTILVALRIEIVAFHTASISQ